MFTVDPRVEADIRQAARWYEKKQPGLGAGFRRAIEAAFKSIESRPSRFSIYEPSSDPAIRRFVLRRFPYVVIFELATDGDVTILLVTHARRRDSRWKRRVR